MMPIPPTMAVMMPIKTPTTLSASVIWLNPCKSLSCRFTEKLSSWSGRSLRALRITEMTSSSVWVTLPAGATTDSTSPRFNPNDRVKAESGMSTRRSCG